MGFHTFTAGEVLTAANMNTYLMNQAVIVCTSGTRPASPIAGMTIFETDTGWYRSYSGAAWQLVVMPTAGTFTPTATVGTALAFSSSTGLYTVGAGRCSVWMRFTQSSGGTTGSLQAFGFPSPCPAPNASLASGMMIGVGQMNGFADFTVVYNGSQTGLAQNLTTAVNYAPAWSGNPVWTLKLDYPL